MIHKVWPLTNEKILSNFMFFFSIMKAYLCSLNRFLQSEQTFFEEFKNLITVYNYST